LSSELAAGIVLVLLAIPMAVAGLGVRYPQLLRPIGTTISILAVAIAFAQTGALQRGNMTSTDIAGLLPAEPFTNRCKQAFDGLIEARVVLAMPTPEGLVVNSDRWNQLPANIQEAVALCASELVPESDAQDLKIIRR
jgi:hypothetical protein